MTASMDMVARKLRDMGEDDIAEKIEGYDLRGGRNTGVEFDEREDGVVKLYQRDGGRTGNYMFDIPMDVYRELKPILVTKIQ